MAAITPGTGTIKANTAEGALLEAAIHVQALEADPASNPNKKEFVNVAIDTNAKQARITATLPISFTDNAAGQVVIIAVPYLT